MPNLPVPESWERLTHIIRTKEYLLPEVFWRTIDNAEAYIRHKQRVKKSSTIDEYILQTYFKETKQPVHNGKYMVRIFTDKIDIFNSSLVSMDTMVNLVFCPNMFPYAVEKNIDHYLLWSLKPIHNAESILRDLLNVPFLCFENPVYKRSVKNVTHYHVFIRHL